MGWVMLLNTKEQRSTPQNNPVQLRLIRWLGEQGFGNSFDRHANP
jgi:hypothetical protein